MSELNDPTRHGVVRLLGGPGTGKTSMLVDAAAARIAAGADPESVLLLCGSAQTAARTRRAVTAAVLTPASRSNPAAGPAAIREPLVRTVHSYAFAVLALAARRTGDPPPRLVTGAEQEAIIRELLAGDVDDGPHSPVAWPASLRPALSTEGFATQLRDLLARCTERGVDPVRLQRIGRLTGHPEWVAAARFAQQYEQVMLLRAAAGMAAPQATVPTLGAAELVGAALEAFATDPELLASERARVRVLLVDDAQHLDPQAGRLVRVLSAGAELTVLAGDPNQAVFGFRGADSALLLRIDADRTVTLTRSHRCAPAVARAVSAVADRLPGLTPVREITGAGEQSGSVSVALAASAHAEAAVIADALRRAHLVDRVPWSQMAVIVRSVSRAAAALPRALAAAGVPVDMPPTTCPAEHPAVRALLTVLAATAAGLDGERAVSLITGPIGRVDPVALRQLRRALRRRETSDPPRELGALLVDALTGELPELPPVLARPMRRVRAVLAAAARSHTDGNDPRYALWRAWEQSGLQRRWLAASERGGVAGAQADRDLDAVTALFDITDEYLSRTPGATLAGLVDHVAALPLPPRARRPSAARDAVTIVSAHAALGSEWDVVVIAGLQEGLWPNTVPRGGVLRTQQLVDLLDGVSDDPASVSSRAPVLAEERRLLVAAMGRARRRLLATAVDTDAGDEAALPSAFFHELAGLAGEPAVTAAVSPASRTFPVAAPRLLAPAALVGRLRSVVCAPAGAVDDQRRRAAATQLARLAAAGVPGADPATWYGMTPVSTDAPLCGGGQPVTLSPSTLQTLVDCPLRWLLERHGGSDARDIRSAVGSLLHALMADGGKTEATLLDELEKVWGRLPYDSQWYAGNELARHRGMLSTFTQWRAQTRHELTEVGTEVEVDGVLTHPEPGLPDVRVRGRVDRLERDAAGRLVVVDIKTGKSPVSKDDAQRHAQLALYQLAVAAGLLAQGDQPGGARLVYVGRSGAGGAAEREQDALTPDARREWQDSVHRAAAATAGPVFSARVNDGCGHCPVRSSCPAHPTGARQ
ncbi:ATP-dependent DNA helicase [Mycobacterium sp.]|uniref:ATP-dependent DNA helicase n=1 Tax=Mycobacterium sp. TaxID=1785 RepID=UPI002D5B9766|nr:ATP-dependent DNA helicase [Mycobacterium sp.]HZA09337.1 ATP-dependent DNA helicase [Mycobacterium sp.]